jgi:hypothetical protein
MSTSHSSLASDTGPSGVATTFLWIMVGGIR